MGLLEEETSRFLEAWMKVRQLVQAANFNRFRRAGLSATQFMALNVVPKEGLTLSELARKLNLSPASLKKTIDSLVDRELVVRLPRSDDARKINILSTAKGRRLQNTASGEFHSFMSGLFVGMSHEERQGLVTGLERLVELSSVPDSKRPSASLHVGGASPAKRSVRRSHQQ